MITSMKNESVELIKKLDELKSRLENKAVFTNVASNDVIKTVALSKEISEDIKEVLIVLQTTMSTEFTASKENNYKDNIHMLNAVGDATKLLGNVIDRLVEMETKTISHVAKNKWNFMVEYKKPISIVIVLVVVWTLGVMNIDVMDHVLTKLLAIIKGV